MRERQGDRVTLFMLALGLLLLGIGGELLVRGAVSTARSLGVSPLLVGLTIVSIGTSMPELVTSLFAAFDDAPGIAVGNVVGSNIANLLLILGITALIAPHAMAPGTYRRESIALAWSTLICTAVVLWGALEVTTGVILLVLLVGYVFWAYRNEYADTQLRRTEHQQVADQTAPRNRALVPSLALMIGGTGAIVLGADWLVESAIELSRRFGISETVIGLSVVAVGTALPELVTSLIAAMRGQSDVAFGNIIGSNVYNVLGILGATAVLHPIRVPPEIAQIDIWVLVAATGMLMLFLRSGKKLGRTEGGILLGGYAIYLAWLVLQA